MNGPDSLVSWVVPDPPPDIQRGALRRAASQTPAVVVEGNPHSAGLWTLPGAGDFGDDSVLSNTELILAELWAQGAIADLVGRTAALRSRANGPGGAPRRKGCWEALYLAYVDLGFRSPTRFQSKLSASLLECCGFDFWPSRSLVDIRFEELEAAWEDFRAVKNVFVRAAVAAEPRLPGPVMIDATLVRSAHRLELVSGLRRRR